MRGELRRAALGCEFTSRSAVEVIKLTLNGAGVFIQFMDRSAGVSSFTASELYIALLPLALSPERQVQGQGDKSLVSQFLGIQIRTLLLHCPHRMADNDRGILYALI